MAKRRTTLLVGVLVAACAPHNPPKQDPAPVSPEMLYTAPPSLPAPPAPRNAPPAESMMTPPPVVEPPRIDSARIDSAVRSIPADTLSAEIAAVFPSLSLDQYAGQDRVEYYVRLFSGNAKARMGARLSAGTRYATVIRDKLRAAGIPEEMTYLALVESGYDPHAYSSAAAVGMWQFMTRTAKDFGLRVDWWIDERRDPMRATDAAIKYLNDLRSRLGSIYLAAAAYNGGEGRVTRGLSRLALDLNAPDIDDHFFTLASSNVLRAETRNYVPQLIAAALIGRDPLAYGITVDTQPAIAFDSVSVAPNTAVPAIATSCGATTKDILDLNGQILRGMTPPDSRVWVRVPVGCSSSFEESMATVDSAERLGANKHVVKKGETPAGIAKKAGISLATWRRYNPKLVKTGATAAISSGTSVLIPTRAALQSAREIPDPGIERYGVAVGGSYVVRKGDTLGGIAERNHTTVASIKRLNGMKSDKIVAGQKLKIK